VTRIKSTICLFPGHYLLQFRNYENDGSMLANHGRGKEPLPLSFLCWLQIVK